MSALTAERREVLVRALKNLGSAGRAEGEDATLLAPGFFPVASHLRLLDPETVLVVGPRGAGKTEIARLLTQPDLLRAVSQHAPRVRMPTPGSRWVQAYGLRGASGFDPIGLRAFLAGEGQSDAAKREVWLAYLVRSLVDIDTEFKAATSDELGPLLSPAAADVAGVFSGLRATGTAAVVALDELDKRLESQDRFLFVTYDELDTLGGGDWPLIEGGVRGLIAFWAAYSRRWRRIRAKVFLRSDLYDRHAIAGGADLAKLAATRVELIWRDIDLYGVLLKRLANVDPELGKFVRHRPGAWSHDPILGYLPRLESTGDAEAVIERVAGRFMGANEKKGQVVRWIVDHVRDGHGRALPRPLVRLFEQGAEEELRSTMGSGRHLLQPTSLRRALDRVSEDHVTDSLDEWPWLKAVRQRFGQALRPKLGLVPWERARDIADLLKGFEGEQRPPFEGRDLIEYLLVLGVLRRRTDLKIDAPDLFLAGLGLRRKGGVRKLQRSR